MLQIAAVTGIYGLSLVTVLAAAAPATLVRVTSTARDGRLDLRPTILAAVALLASWGFGAYRLSGADPGAVVGFPLRFVQGTIPPLGTRRVRGKSGQDVEQQ